MKKVVLIPDSFKGTMSSSEICGIMAQAIRRFYPQAEVLSIPVADGGEGSVDAFLAAMEGEKRFLQVKGPFGEAVEGFYGVLDGGRTAVIEMAACAGLPLAGGRKDPEKTTTYGVGQLLCAAAESGCEKIILGLGGSATNDAGVGAACAAGVRFLKASGEAFLPVGGTLCDVAAIDASCLSAALRRTEIVAMCDIDNPLFGETGAAAVFGPQKGADEAAVRRLDRGLRHISRIIERDLGADVSLLPGAGAAGGMGGGAKAFFGARLKMGIETVLDTVGFDEKVRGADLVFSGEGKLDSQSVRGKVVVGVARRAKAAGVPLIAVVGDIGDEIEPVYGLGVSAVFSINRVAVEYARAKPRARDDLRLTMENLMRFFAATGWRG